MREKISCVYMIRNVINDNKYVGITGDYLHRKQCHTSALNRHKHSNKHLQRAWNKYGSKNFEFSIIEIVEKSFLPEREIYWIDFYDSCNNGYNQTYGGDGTVNVKYPVERGIKIGKALRGRKYPEHSGVNASNARKIVCLDTGEQFGCIKDASKMANIIDTAIINSCKNHKAICDNKYVFLYLDEYLRLSQEEIEEIKNKAHAKYGIKTPKNIKRVICLNTLEIYTDGRAAAGAYNVEHSYLIKCCHGFVSSAGKDKNGNGLTWMFLDEYKHSSKHEIQKRIDKAYLSSRRNIPIKIKCITTNCVFDSCAQAVREYHLTSQCSLKRHLDSDGIYGIHPKTKEKLVWERVS